MTNHCVCGRNKIESNHLSAYLLQSFFIRLADRYAFYLLCTECGEDILRGYKDPYGLAV